MPPTLRQAVPGDAAALAALAGELGYPAEPDEFERRLVSLSPEDDVWVATIDGEMVGWVHCSVCRSLVVEPHLVILGIIVGDKWRQQGIGRELMAAAERSASERGVSAIRLRSGSQRDEAHAFYRAVGYREQKTQLVFVREVDR